MSTLIAMQDIRETLAAIAQRAEHGEEFIVVRNSKPSFRIVPYEQEPAAAPVRQVPALRDITRRIDRARRTHRLSPDIVDEIIHELHGTSAR